MLHAATTDIAITNTAARVIAPRTCGSADAPEHTPEVVAPLISRGLAELAKLPG
ncbi:hypothetical protein [Mycobacterium colombiense]|uniref:hypothetical protein n=1 Tax=Mycobacterium colombiense TaxID=339268 RepID=UPI0012DB5CD7|nr:hypothetical protein [Mycobacterium colombiense]